MAKKIKIGLAVYALGNNYTSTVKCKGCGYIFKHPQRAYSSIKYDDPKCYIVLIVLKNLRWIFERNARKMLLYIL